jgi:asparagine synthase (glutamine-hydrolysing)
MCGIVGVAGTGPIGKRDWLTAGRDLMHHRGPDDFGVWWSKDGRVGFAHRRLAIIDLSPAGHQPMLNEEGGTCIVLNGEIYNFIDMRQELRARGHVFRSQSDTEVILAAYQEWGTNCVQRMNGMFAFALYDVGRNKLFMARDRAGEKPLFYSFANGEMRFASELKGLMADPDFLRSVDAESLDCYLSMGFIPGERCILRGVNKLPPAHALEFDLTSGSVSKWRYWDLPEAPVAAAQDHMSEFALVNELEGLLEDSVRRQLVADVTVGVLLSGGVDSSLITAMAVRTTPRVRTFTMRFPGHGKFDETEHARLIARHFETQHVELDATELSVALLPALARQFDEPVADSSMIATHLVSRLTREHCTVALGGDGGDELFGGYHHYSRLLRMRRMFDRIPAMLRIPVARAAGILPVGIKGRNWLQGLNADWLRSLPWLATHFDCRTRRQLMQQYGGWHLVAERIREQSMDATAGVLQRATRSDMENYLAEDILVKVDRSSMLNSLEVRAPFLDYRIIEFAFARVPETLKATATDQKIILKRLAARVLPPQFDQRRKQGFSIPLASWLKSSSWRDLLREVLIDSNQVTFDKKTVLKLMHGQVKGRANSERLFALLMFQLWRNEYQVSM